MSHNMIVWLCEQNVILGSRKNGYIYLGYHNPDFIFVHEKYDALSFSVIATEYEYFLESRGVCSLNSFHIVTSFIKDKML